MSADASPRNAGPMSFLKKLIAGLILVLVPTIASGLDLYEHFRADEAPEAECAHPHPDAQPESLAEPKVETKQERKARKRAERAARARRQ